MESSDEKPSKSLMARAEPDVDGPRPPAAVPKNTLMRGGRGASRLTACMAAAPSLAGSRRNPAMVKVEKV